MKNILILCGLFLVTTALAQPAGKKYKLKDIGWTITLPADFTAFPTADSSIQLAPGQQGDSVQLYKRLMMAMSDNNLFVVTIALCDQKVISDNYAAEKLSYQSEAKAGGVQLDSATTFVSIGGLTLRKFRITTRKNNLLVNNFVTLSNCYKGYVLRVTYSYYNRKAGEEIEAMLQNSTFH